MVRAHLSRNVILNSFLLAAVTVVYVAAVLAPVPVLAAKAAKPAKSANTTTIGRDPAKLPEPVAEMRDAILAAVHSGKIEELIVPIQWNELKPDFGDVDADKPIAGWKKLSVDGNGAEILAILHRLLNSPYAVIRQGSDIENNKIFVWPYHAEMPLQKLTPRQQTELLTIIPASAFKKMTEDGKYNYWRISIGADGTWHELIKVTP